MRCILMYQCVVCIGCHIKNEVYQPIMTVKNNEVKKKFQLFSIQTEY